MAFILISGRVKSGRAVGRKIGFPTINLPAKASKSTWGVYCALAKLGKSWRVGVAHLGPASTYGQTEVLCETFLLNSPALPRSMAGKSASVLMIKKLRGTKKFKTPGLMQKQIAKDVKAAEKFFNLV